MNVNKIIFRFVSISFSILVLLLVIVGLLRIGNFCYEFGYRVFTEQPVDAAPGRDVVVQVTDDMSEKEIGDMLADKGLVNDGTLFFAQLKLSAYSGDLNAGVYTLNTSMTAKDMMVIMAAGPEEVEPIEEETVEGTLEGTTETTTEEPTEGTEDGTTGE